MLQQPPILLQKMFSGFVFSLTGQLDRDELTNIIKKHGGTTSGIVHKKASHNWIFVLSVNLGALFDRNRASSAGKYTAHPES
jgi:hypothetical protein